MRIAKLALLVACLAACTSSPPQSPARATDYGAAPMDYVAAIHRYFDTAIPDRAAVQYRGITSPERVSIRDEPITGGETIYGWLVNATVNVKGASGAYIVRHYGFLFRGERLVRALPPQEEVSAK